MKLKSLSFSLSTAAATFFCAYELTRSFVGDRLENGHGPMVDMLAASVGEMVRLI